MELAEKEICRTLKYVGWVWFGLVGVGLVWFRAEYYSMELAEKICYGTHSSTVS
jgi:hypothetical protein